MDLNEFANDVHALAVEKGFYDPEPTDAELIAGIHAEISEAFEEWNAGRPMVYRLCYNDEPMSVFNQVRYCEAREKGQCTRSPVIVPGERGCCGSDEFHGIAVELIDVVLRVLDAAATWGVTVHRHKIERVSFHPNTDYKELKMLTVPELVCALHDQTVGIFAARANNPDLTAKCMSYMLSTALQWLEDNGIAPDPLLLEKHEYNKTRPYRHGGKRV